jgi:hypothetical protein
MGAALTDRVACCGARTGAVDGALDAMMESFFSSLQSDVLDIRTRRARDELRSGLFDYLEITYNRERRHSSLTYLTPERSRTNTCWYASSPQERVNPPRSYRS